jgi:hypothetical protein
MRVATFFPLREGEGVTTFLPVGCHLHAPSWDPRNAAALAREVEIHYLHVTPAKGRTPWPPGGPAWGRERFCHRRTAAGMLAYSTDSRGRIIRGWFSNPTDHAAYAAGGSGSFGPITCPIEAVVLEHLQPGVPGIPAHLLIGADRGWPGYREALSRMVKKTRIRASFQ